MWVLRTWLVKSDCVPDENLNAQDPGHAKYPSP